MNRRGFLAGLAAFVAAPQIPHLERIFAYSSIQVERGPIITVEGLAACLKQAYPAGSFDWIHDEAPFRKALR